MNKPKIIAIIGPTASGKSSLAIDLACRFHGEIVSADSVQVYRFLDIGTAKPTPGERRRVPHHLIDILNPDEDYSAALFREHADRIIAELDARKTPVFVVGGTGLYLKALVRGLFSGPGADPQLRRKFREAAEKKGSSFLHEELKRIDPHSAARIYPRDTLRIIRALEVFALTQRPISGFQEGHRFQENRYDILKIGLWVGREELYRRINLRVDRMMEEGWLEEVRAVLGRGYSPDSKPLRSLGYKEIISYLTGEAGIEETIDLVKKSTRRYAKRQLTWFKADPQVNWFPVDEENCELIGDSVEEFLSGDRFPPP